MPDLGIDVLFKGTNFIRLLGGLWTALEISLISVGLSIPLGILLGIVMTIPNKAIKVITKIYLEIIRIMPQLVLLFIVFFGATRTMGINISGEVASVIVFTLWGTAEMGDLVRGSIISIPKHQSESSLALGLSKAQTYLYINSADGTQTFAAFNQPCYKNDKDYKPYPYDWCCRGYKGCTTDY